MKPILSIEEALSPDAPQLYPEFPGNVVPAEPFAQMHMAYNTVKTGDVKRASPRPT